MSTNSATPFEDPMDPTDFLDFLSQFNIMLEASETIAAGFTVIASAAALALGFEISTAIPPALQPGNQSILFWSQVNVAQQKNAAYDDEGIQIEVNVKFTTSLSRIFERSFLITVKQL